MPGGRRIPISGANGQMIVHPDLRSVPAWLVEIGGDPETPRRELLLKVLGLLLGCPSHGRRPDHPAKVTIRLVRVLTGVASGR